MNIKKFRIEEDPFAKFAQGISKNYHAVINNKKFLQNKPQFKSMNIECYDLYYTFIKNRDEKGIVINKINIIENDYINFDDFVIPSHNISIKLR